MNKNNKQETAWVRRSGGTNHQWLLDFSSSCLSDNLTQVDWEVGWDIRRSRGGTDSLQAGKKPPR